MINALQGIGYGIIGLAILVGVGMVMLGQLGSTIASCSTGYTYEYNGSGYFYGGGKCCLNNGKDCSSTGNYTNPSTATQTIYTINNTYLATNLVQWLPVIIVLSIGMLFLGAFLVRRFKNKA